MLDIGKVRSYFILSNEQMVKIALFFKMEPFVENSFTLEFYCYRSHIKMNSLISDDTITFKLTLFVKIVNKVSNEFI